MKTVCIGLGYRGRQLFGLLRRIPFFQLAAVADPSLADEVLPPGIACYNRGEDDYLRMLA